ncbi:unnamed protein product [Lactuca saligna]|uniref:FAD-binding FR-type domain-containing protein n=1 Tax=Lactuca saligna TaxID=75948 RepID=A0AA36EEZ6_LACSI|nr:unnamed protein product [Lactuca saligna]
MSTEYATDEPLLSSSKQDNGFNYVIQTRFLVKFTRWVLKFAMCSIFFAWITFLFLLPSNSVSDFAEKYVDSTSGSVFWVSGSIFLYGGPLFIIAFLAILYLRISGEQEFEEKKKPKHATLRLWTFPVIVDGPFGVVTAAELIVILLVVVYIICALSVYAIQNYNLIPYYESQGKSHVMLKHTGLRLTNIPFEHATRYHVWLGHLTMTLFTLHGSCYFISWILENRVLHQVIDWKNNKIANLPGVISLSAGLLIMIAGGLFLYMLDRFLRFFQSRKSVEILSAKCLPSGTVELVISKPQDLKYNALSWVFLQVRELSWLQWHPFSVSSSPLDGDNHLSILIKVLGNWTNKLKSHILSLPEDQTDLHGLIQPNLKLKAYVEGPYGHESPYHLMYENLILVAGGIGISPFVAILSDILHRIKECKPCMPRNVLIIWAVKTSEELPLLHSLDLESLFPNFHTKLNLEIQTYITQESEPPLEEGNEEKYATPFVYSTPSRCGMSGLVGTGNIIWSGTYVVVSTIGLVVSLTLLNVFYINTYDVTYRWYKGLLVLICMIISVIVFGGLVICLWHLSDTKTSKKEKSWDKNQTDEIQHKKSTTSCKHSSEESFVKTTKYGQRPDLKEIFGRMCERWGNVDIGVIVCGPTSLRSSVAKECRCKNFGRRSNNPVFHFNSHSFDLGLPFISAKEETVPSQEKTKWH